MERGMNNYRDNLLFDYIGQAFLYILAFYIFFKGMFNPYYFLIFFLLFVFIRKYNYLFLVGLIGAVAFKSKEFCYISLNVAGLPVYMLELGIIFSAALLLLWLLVRNKLVVYIFYKKYFILLFLIFCIAFISGLYSYTDKLFVIRQSALFYYAVFSIFIPLFLNSMQKIDTAMVIIVVCSLLNYIFKNNFSYFYLALGAIILAGELIVSDRRNIFKYLLYSLIFLYMIYLQFFYFQTRASWIGLGLVFLFGVFFVPRLFQRSRFNISFLFLPVFILLLISTLYPKKFEYFYKEASSIVVFHDIDQAPSSSKANVYWRLYAWRDTMLEGLKKPVFGWGFGRKYYPEVLKEKNYGGAWRKKGWQDPHNSFISIFFRTGFAGLAVFLFFIIRIFKDAVRIAKNVNNDRIKKNIFMLLSCILYILGTAFFMPSLICPYMGVFLWIFIGMLFSMMRIARDGEQVDI